MSKIKISGSAVTLTSAIKLEDIKFAKKYAPEALVVVEEDDKEYRELFAITTGYEGDIDENGIVFARANSEGFAEVTVLVSDFVSDIKDYVVHKFFGVVDYLNTIEEQVNATVKDVKARFAKFESEIESDDAPKAAPKKASK